MALSRRDLLALGGATLATATLASGVWDGVLKSYRPNLGYDYGGRLLAAWLDR